MSVTGRVTQDDLSRESLFVQKLLMKTGEGKIAWQRLPSSVSAITSNGMQFDFILAAPMPGSQQSWVSFTARDQGVELFKFQHPVQLMAMVVGGPNLGTLDNLLGALFRAATMRATDFVGRAIAKLEQL